MISPSLFLSSQPNCQIPLVGALRLNNPVGLFNTSNQGLQCVCEDVCAFLSVHPSFRLSIYLSVYLDVLIEGVV